MSAPRTIEKSPEREKRPFLRKNQGRAAWCSRLRSSMTKLQEYSTKMRADHPFTRASSSDQESSVQSKIDIIGPIAFSNRPTKMYTRNSPWNPLPNYRLFPIPQEECENSFQPSAPSPPPEPTPREPPPPPRSLQHAATKTASNDLSDNGELEEFELLERFAEDQVCAAAVGRAPVPEVHPPSMVSKRSGNTMQPALTVETPKIAGGDFDEFGHDRYSSVNEEKMDSMWVWLATLSDILLFT